MEVPLETFEGIISGIDLNLTLDPESALLKESYEHLVAAKDTLFGACSAFAEDTSNEVHVAVNISAGTYMAALHRSIATIQSTLPQDASLNAIYNLAMSADAACTNHFREMTNTDHFAFMQAEWLRDMLGTMRQMTPEDESFVGAVTQHLGAVLSQDLSLLLNKLRIQHQEQVDKTRTISIGRTALSHPSPHEQDGDTHTYYAFRVEPPLQLHNPGFMAPHADFDFEGSSATYGKFWIPDSFESNRKPAQRESAIRKLIVEQFEQHLNPFGDGIMHYVWQENVVPDNET